MSRAASIIIDVSIAVMLAYLVALSAILIWGII